MAARLIAASGLNQTDMSTHKMEEVLYRHHNESTDNYINRLKEKLAEMKRDRAINVDMISKGLKKYGNLDVEESPSYSSDEYEVVG